MKIKMMFLGVILLIISLSNLSFAATMEVELLESNYTLDLCITGNHQTGPELSDFEPVSESYHKTSNQPISHELYVKNYLGWNEANGYANSFSAHAYSHSSDLGAIANTGAEVSASWVFSPIVDYNNEISIDLYYWIWADFRITLIDLTSEAMIYYMDPWGDTNPEFNSLIISHSFQHDHTYSLQFWVYSGACGDEGEAYIYTNDIIASIVPEPTTIYLFGISLLFLAGINRRKN